MRRIVIAIICCSATQWVSAQQTGIFTDPEVGFKQAKDYFQREQYSLAYPLFKELSLQLREPDRSGQSLNYQDVLYYTLVCALRQNEKGAVDQAIEYVDLNDNESRVELMSYHLGEYYFRQKKYYQASTYYEKTSVAHLNNAEVASLKFHQGYCYFNLQRFDVAKPLLDAVRQVKDNPDYAAANYYYGFICFRDKQYREALAAFKIVENDPEFQQVVPYYIATIYYLTGDKTKALSYAQEKLQKGNGYYDLELKRLVGHGLYETRDYKKALPYLEAYAAKTSPLSRNDLYELSYSYYTMGNYPKAIAGFKQLGGSEDSLAQNSMYLLADAYLKTKDKANARNAFLFCARNSSNPTQQEISSFNYGKLSYELGFPDIALTELKQFLTRYPNSQYNIEAREILVGVMTRTSNYKDALALLDGIKNPSEQVKQFYPGILYGRATELVNDGMLPAADQLLDRAIQSPYNQSVLPLVNFWKGEIAFRNDKTDEAIKYYSDYLAAPVTNSEVNPQNARYNLGYSYLQKESYKQALVNFDQAYKAPAKKSSPVEQDAFIRSADCNYMLRDYKKASAMYDQVIQFGWASADYASFQKAMIAGIGNSNDKIRQMQQMQRNYPVSSLVPDANMEIANTYMGDEKFKEAIPFLNAVIKDARSEALKPKAYLKSGIANYNLDNNAEALNQYNALLQQYPNSPEADEALDNAKAIYVEEGRSGEYVGFAKKMGRDISTSQQDSLAYAEAEVQLSNGNFTNALQRFDAYLVKYPEGRYVIEANYYQAEIHASRKEWVKAAAGYESVAARVPNRFGEKSLLQAARLNFFELKQYEKAAGYYTSLKEFASSQENKLEAMRGLLRSQYQLEKWNEAQDNAKELLQYKGASADDKLLANMVLAKAAEAEGQFDLAIGYYKNAASGTKGELSAASRYGIASCQFKQSKWKDAEKSAFEVIHKNGSYELWVTRSYLLLGDIYMQQQDFFNAKATFQSVVENASIPELKEEAQRKLNKATEAERKQTNAPAAKN
ncbi:tetratricopeptide repeat protein [Flavihumibacter profundi]|uniref:tetratricopeptide repeat protein n=1 Tax=Flavihumibacter profundi TaxID=2716883 RepID=UPI001CC6B311|nr:tetratricopeptide repeat protein [Flavihumibacter profundi]MBZ5855726.1 tetratricopeptide repeat protein [Flavihumibacter profundi]